MICGRELLFLLGASALASGEFWGKAAFAGLFLLLAVGLVLFPRRWIGQEAGAPPPWKNVRYWAIAIALVQLLVYAILG